MADDGQRAGGVYQGEGSGAWNEYPITRFVNLQTNLSMISPQVKHTFDVDLILRRNTLVAWEDPFTWDLQRLVFVQPSWSWENRVMDTWKKAVARGMVLRKVAL